MLNWFKSLKKEKETIVLIHGFGKRKTMEFDNLLSALDGNDIVTPVLFDHLDEGDDNCSDWIYRAEQALSEAKNKSGKVILIGFSMGGVIASYLASKYHVDKLILLAPAFEYFTIKTATSAVSKMISKSKSSTPDLPSNFTSTFMEVVNNYKNSIESIKCPTLMIHASDDEVIPSSVSTKYYQKLKTKHKNCVIIEGGSHRLLDDQEVKDIAIFLTKSFIKNSF